jgi:hypothetical protein
MAAWPRSAARSAAARSASGTVASSASRSAGPPIWYSVPSTSAATPLPVIARNPSALGMSMSRSPALATMPRAMGCSDSVSMPAAIRSASSSDVPSATARSTTRNSPSVSVPVLSKMTTSRFRASSSPRRSRTSRPFWAPMVVEIATTRGTARPRAWGHAMTRTVTIRTMVKSMGAPMSCQTTSVMSAAAMATPVSIWAARSARCCARDFDFWASATSRMIPDSLVFARPRDLHPQRPLAVDGPGDHLVALALLHRARLARDHGLVQVAPALENYAIDRDAFARPYQDHVTLPQVGDGHFLLRAVVSDPAGRIRQQLGQLLERALGLGDGAHLDPVA